MGLYPTTQSLPTFKTASPTTPSDAMTESLFSESFPITTSNQFMAHASWTGSPVGLIKVMGSQDNINFNNPIYSVSTVGITGINYDLFGTSVMWIRLEYTFSSGSGTLTCSASTKV